MTQVNGSKNVIVCAQHIARAEQPDKSAIPASCYNPPIAYISEDVYSVTVNLSLRPILKENKSLTGTRPDLSPLPSEPP